MRSIKQMLEGRGAPMSVRPGDTVFQALEAMAAKDIGALLVIEGGKLVGIFSERDYARKVILKGKASKDIPVSEVMSDRIVYVTPEQTVEECMAIMTDRHCRHLPVLGPGQAVIGILSIGDLVKETIAEQKFIIDQLERYITQ
jgi:CBS domain-containing protein